ncbi:alkylhydroperoxidase like protein, AhpD family [Desulfotomaculum nigrificans CO-1-SRB]|uniref:Dihydrolipoamide acetyltransferase component of pyruvate dehydrogenase complex n=1 Tax=Desulfotomaculum nigrificans (strain DSM 14880 / VKM B-2319 / CO-1-SRB) TaxID=868595 RepID=F6B905_DESCC|nr:2-oxo acid dehydrogenase subunit E2 [Desulfotomaculum nigrificans]AEF93656.1 alkylhydroperoxidase like protein, AhpD family [Desulfotomaculum nigrificans CO-1-SRB]
MANIVLLPKLGLTMKKGKIVNWLKQEGDQVEQGEALLEIVTEKANVKVESPAAGVVHKILAGKGTQLPVNAPIAVIAEAGDDEARLQKTLQEAQANFEQIVSTVPQPQKAQQVATETVSMTTVKRSISPRAKKLAEKEGINLSLVEGTGPNGRITEKDVVAYIEDLAKDNETQIIPFEGMRQIIAQRMSESSRNAARVTIMQEVDVTILQMLRKRYNDAGAAKGLRLSFTDVLIKAVVKALREHRNMNARVYDDHMELVNAVNIGVAVDIEGGLVVPVIHNAHRLTLEQISAKVKDLAARARSGDLEAEELQGGTFTVSNLGVFGAEGFTPIINPPETAILGVGQMTEKPGLSEDNLLRKKFVTLSLSLDHRAVDGGPGARFLKRIKELLEDPFELFGMPKDPSIKHPLIGGAKDPRQIRNKYRKGMSLLSETNPDLVMGFSALTEGIFFEDGEISVMHKELIAVALAVYIKCEYCIAAHIYSALEQGATPEQVMEAASVAAFFGGGAAMAYVSTFVQDCIEAFSKEIND